MKKRILLVLLSAILMATTVFGCTSAKEKKKEVRLNPDNPVTLTVWHYYNGAQQAAFDELVSEFNATTGREVGIYVEGFSQGSVADLEEALTKAVNEEVGAEKMPDIFSTYADTAYSLQKKGRLANLSEYFEKEELDYYIDSYVEEGYFSQDDALYLFPIAKSTEIMMLNETDWETFAQECNVSYEDLKTTEGVTRVAELYYNWTDSLTPDILDDGKAFYGRDSMSNYFIIGMKQMGTELFEVKDATVTINADKDLIRRLWDNYYVPYMKGYFDFQGKFRSDDVKTGDILCYTGSTSSSMYFPDKLETEDGNKEINFKVLPAPVFEGGEAVCVQQGASMAVAKSDAEHEYASCVFLKWFTQKENNISFVCDSGYLPVLKESNTITELNNVIAMNNINPNPIAYECLKEVMKDFEQISFYTPHCFDNGYSTRKVLDYNLSDKAKADREAVEAEMAAGASKEEALEPYLSEEAFESWYESFVTALNEEAFATNH